MSRPCYCCQDFLQLLTGIVAHSGSRSGFQVLERAASVINGLSAQALTAKYEPPKQRASARPANQPGTQYVTFAQLLAVPINIK